MNARDIPVWPADTAEIRELMREQHKTQGALGSLLGVGRPTANKYLSGILPIRLDDLVRIADWLRVPFEQVVGKCEGGCGCPLHLRQRAA